LFYYIDRTRLESHQECLIVCELNGWEGRRFENSQVMHVSYVLLLILSSRPKSIPAEKYFDKRLR